MQLSAFPNPSDLNSVAAAVAPSIGVAANSFAELGVGASQGADGPGAGPAIFAAIFGGLVAPPSPVQVRANDGPNILSGQPSVGLAQGFERGFPSICSLTSVGEETETESDPEFGFVRPETTGRCGRRGADFEKNRPVDRSFAETAGQPGSPSESPAWAQMLATLPVFPSVNPPGDVEAALLESAAEVAESVSMASESVPEDSSGDQTVYRARPTRGWEIDQDLKRVVGGDIERPTSADRSLALSTSAKSDREQNAAILALASTDVSVSKSSRLVSQNAVSPAGTRPAPSTETAPPAEFPESHAVENSAEERSPLVSEEPRSPSGSAFPAPESAAGTEPATHAISRDVRRSSSTLFDDRPGPSSGAENAARSPKIEGIRPRESTHDMGTDRGGISFWSARAAKLSDAPDGRQLNDVQGAGQPHKKSLWHEDKGLTEYDGFVGTAIAKPGTVMPAATLSRNESSALGSAGSLADASGAAGLASANEHVSGTAQEAVETIRSLAERLAATDHHTVNLRFTIGGNELRVRVGLWGDEVRTAFRTESVELRAALVHEWQAVNAPVSDRAPMRFADPVFSSTTEHEQGSSSFSSDTASHKERGESGAWRDALSSSVNFSRPPASNNPPPTPRAAAPRIPDPISSTRRLRTFA